MKENYHICQSFVNSLLKINERKNAYWDDKIRGFGIRCRKNSMSYVVFYRNAQRKFCWLTLGGVDKIKADFARNLAIQALADVAKGLDPAHKKQENKTAITVSELCDWYMKEGTLLKKESTKKDDVGRINNYIKPLLGGKIVESVRRRDVEKFLFEIETKSTIKSHKGEKRHGSFARGGQGVATRILGLLGAIFEFAYNRELVEINPCRGIKRPPDKRRDAFLTFNDLFNFGKALSAPELVATSKMGLDIIKLLILTGCRREEIASLKWEFIDFSAQCFRFPDTKTGKQNRPFGIGALHLLENLRNGQIRGYVFPSSVGGGYNRTANRVFNRIKKLKNERGDYLIRQDLTLHGLRHSFASLAASLGYSDFTIAGLLGHRLATVTSRYTHTIDKSLVDAADQISLKIEFALSNDTVDTF